MSRILLLTLLTVSLGGCFLLPDRRASCSRPQPYESAEQQPALSVPEGATAPDRRNVMKIPELKSPPPPKDPTRCLDEPPPFGETRPKGS
ncbi:MAG: hypothetical protein FJ191_09925 [Gammaproteobacteria bacterium]|nr:hypothetical protein [Gammaproteobacteria bacterium]